MTAGRTVNVDASYMYDMEGRMTQVTYPTTFDYFGVAHAGPVYNIMTLVRRFTSSLIRSISMRLDWSPRSHTSRRLIRAMWS